MKMIRYYPIFSPFFLIFLLISCMEADPGLVVKPTSYIPESIGFTDFPESLLTFSPSVLQRNSNETLPDQEPYRFLEENQSLKIAQMVISQSQETLAQINATLTKIQSEKDFIFAHENEIVPLPDSTESIQLEPLSDYQYRLTTYKPSADGSTLNKHICIEWNIQSATPLGVAYIRDPESPFINLRVDFDSSTKEPMMEIRGMHNPDQPNIMEQFYLKTKRLKNKNIVLQSHVVFLNQPILHPDSPVKELPANTPAKPYISIFGYVLENGTGGVKDQLEDLVIPDVLSDFSLNAFLVSTSQSQLYFDSYGAITDWSRFIQSASDDQSLLYEVLHETYPNLFGVTLNEQGIDQTIRGELNAGSFYQEFSEYRTTYFQILEE